jgi:hypothetical protein
MGEQGEALLSTTRLPELLAATDTVRRPLLVLVLTDSSYFCVSREARVSKVSSGRASNM